MLCSAAGAGMFSSCVSHHAAWVGHRILEGPGASGTPAESQQTVFPQILVCVGLNPMEVDPFAPGMCAQRTSEEQRLWGFSVLERIGAVTVNEERKCPYFGWGRLVPAAQQVLGAVSHGWGESALPKY